MKKHIFLIYLEKVYKNFLLAKPFQRLSLLNHSEGPEKREVPQPFRRYFLPAKPFQRLSLLNHSEGPEKQEVPQPFRRYFLPAKPFQQLVLLFLIFMTNFLFAEYPDGNIILKQIDENMYAKNMISTSQMIVHGRRGSRTMEIKSWTEGENRSFSEYLSPPRDAGTKMLKLDDKLWIYNPSADRTIQISGHMLRQSMMGSDISYEDMMEENELTEVYSAVTIGDENFNDISCWILELTAITDDAAYQTKKVWIDKEKLIPLKEERYGKSGKLLKTTEILEVMKIGKRWYPKRMIFKDVLKKGKGTEFIIDDIQFDVEIPESRFSKAALRK